jgi:Domain of unknown function (DUF6456)
MTEVTTPNISPAALRLRRHLDQVGAFARLSGDARQSLDLFRASKAGPTLGAGTVVSQAADELIQAGLAIWNGERLEAATGQPLSGGRPAPLRDLASVALPGEPSRRVIVNRAESPLAWLAARHGSDGKPLLSPRCVAAGERLRADLERSAMLPRLGVDWSRSPGTGGGPLRYEPGEAALAARQRCEAALGSVGPDLSGLLLDVCGFLKGLSVVEGERGWPPRSARIVLELALKRLADHYGFADDATGPQILRRQRHVWRPDSAVPDRMPGSG